MSRIEFQGLSFEAADVIVVEAWVGYAADLIESGDPASNALSLSAAVTCVADAANSRWHILDEGGPISFDLADLGGNLDFLGEKHQRAILDTTADLLTVSTEGPVATGAKMRDIIDQLLTKAQPND